MTPFAFSGLLTGINCSILALISLIYGRTRIHFILFLFNFACALWGLGCFTAGIAHNEYLALFGWKLAHTGGFFISILYFHLTCILCNINRKFLLTFGYAQAVIFNWLSWFQGNLITKTRFVYGIYYNDATFLYYFGVSCYSILVVASFCAFLAFLKRSKGLERTRILYLLTAFLFGFIGGTSIFLSEFRIDIAYPFGNFGISLYPIIMTYAILKYNLMDINIIIRKSLIYSLLVTTITFIFFIFVLISEHLFHQVIHYQNVNTSFIMVGLIALIFTPLKNRIQILVDRAFFKATPMEMAQQNEQLRQKERILTDLYSQADKLSKTDNLTKINNRGHFSQMLNEKMQECEGAKTSFYLVIFDVDHFKEINDSYGHIFGDKVLVKVIDIVKNNVRSNDFIGRFGGDEFVICLDFPNKESILNRLTKISHDIKAISLIYDEKEIPISVSIGAAKFIPGIKLTEEQLIEKADRELFNVKKTTRGEIRING